MHETGVSERAFPELEKIECLVIRDFYHRYTVDEHTLVTMQTLRGAARLQRSDQQVLRDIFSELADPCAAFFALLFHDVGKGVPGDGTWMARCALAETPCSASRCPRPDRETVLFLIRSHLEMSEAMQSRDIFDPATAQYLAHGWKRWSG